jgi:hypothetical protein
MDERKNCLERKTPIPPPPFFKDFAVFAVALSLICAGCGGGDDAEIPVEFADITSDGAPSTTTTTKLTITFSEEIAGLSLGNITLTGAAKGAQLRGIGKGAYELTLSGVEAEEEMTVGVSRSGYRVSPASMTVPVHKNTGVPVANAGNIPSIKAKFGITETGGAKGVTLAFNELHSYIQKNSNNLSGGVIKPGDWIDMEGGLEVDAYNDTGGFSHDAAKAMEKVYNKGESWGTLCRLIVAGVNSFNNINGNDTPHVVFQFQNIPVTRRMNPDNDNEGGYEKSEMRKYLVPVTGDDESGNFLTGLYSAGVPKGVLWGPARTLSKGTNGTGTVILSDLLWLPTEREMFQNGKSHNGEKPVGPYSANGETADNQARLAYYTNSTRLKAWCGDGTGYYPNMKFGAGAWYWTGSSHYLGSSWFCNVSYLGSTLSNDASSAGGVAPAFCVK